MSSCYRFMFQLLQVWAYAIGSLPVIVGSSPIATWLSSRYRFKIIVAGSFLDSSTLVWGSWIGCDVAGSICYELPRCFRFIPLRVKANQRGPVASYHEPFNLVVLRINDQLEMSILSYESGMMKPPIYCIKLIVTRQFFLFCFFYFQDRDTSYKWGYANTKDTNAHIFMWNLYLNCVWSVLCI